MGSYHTTPKFCNKQRKVTRIQFCVCPIRLSSFLDITERRLKHHLSISPVNFEPLLGRGKKYRPRVGLARQERNSTVGVSVLGPILTCKEGNTVQCMFLVIHITELVFCRLVPATSSQRPQRTRPSGDGQPQETTDLAIAVDSHKVR